jgi:hypothetical protein
MYDHPGVMSTFLALGIDTLPAVIQAVDGGSARVRGIRASGGALGHAGRRRGGGQPR